MKNKLIKSIAAIIIVGFCVSFTGLYVADNEFHKYPTVEPAEVNYFGKQYHNGEILLPDYAISDTLVVINADLLNEIMPLNEGSDDAISIALGEGTIPFADLSK